MRSALIRGSIAAALVLAHSVLAAPGARADMMEGVDISALAATEFEGKPIIAFSAFDGILGSELPEVIIATPSRLEPASGRDWRFHRLRQGLEVMTNDEMIEGQLAFAKAGSGLALVFLALTKGPHYETLVAWTPHYPQLSSDWRICHTGQDLSDEIAAVGTDDYLAFGCIFWGTAQVTVVVAPLPLLADATGWHKVDVPILIDGVPAQVLWDQVCSPLTLTAVGEKLYAATLVRTTQGYSAVLGVCDDPLHDLSQWKFSVVATDPNNWRQVLTAVGSQLSLAYSTSGEPSSVMAGRCEASAALDPSAWHWVEVDPQGGVNTGARVADGAGFAYRILLEREQKHRQRVAFAWNAVRPEGADNGQSWVTSVTPITGWYLHVLGIQGKPAIAGYCFGDPGRVLYAWSDRAVPCSEKDWHLCTVFKGKPSGIPREDGTLVERLEDLARTYWVWLVLAVPVAVVVAVVVVAVRDGRRRRRA
jgi:hypothetical protein